MGSTCWCIRICREYVRLFVFLLIKSRCCFFVEIHFWVVFAIFFILLNLYQFFCHFSPFQAIRFSGFSSHNVSHNYNYIHVIIHVIIYWDFQAIGILLVFPVKTLLLNTLRQNRGWSAAHISQSKDQL